MLRPLFALSALPSLTSLPRSAGHIKEQQRSTRTWSSARVNGTQVDWNLSCRAGQRGRLDFILLPRVRAGGGRGVPLREGQSCRPHPRQPLLQPAVLVLRFLSPAARSPQPAARSVRCHSIGPLQPGLSGPHCISREEPKPVYKPLKTCRLIHLSTTLVLGPARWHTGLSTVSRNPQINTAALREPI